MSDNLQESTGYTALAEYYDRLMSDVRYDEWASFYEMVFHKYCTEQPTLVLDLGCGTGRLTCELSGRGYDMIGVDLSEDMLAQAAARAGAEGGQSILFLQQDMQSIELYGTVDAMICSLDGINYLRGGEPLLRCFCGVANYLNPGGIFIFDVNTVYKYTHILANQIYTQEAEGVFCVCRCRGYGRNRLAIAEFDARKGAGAGAGHAALYACHPCNGRFCLHRWATMGP